MFKILSDWANNIFSIQRQKEQELVPEDNIESTSFLLYQAEHRPLMKLLAQTELPSYHFANPLSQHQALTYLPQAGFFYEGDVLNGRPHGLGKGYFSDKFYYGSFSEGVPNGRGVFLYQNGDRFEGQVLRGQLNGRGIYESRNGYYYQGDFILGKRTGEGMERQSNHSWFIGIFKDNFMQAGELYHLARTSFKATENMDPADQIQFIKRSKNKDLYIGYFKDNLYSGKGSYFWADGRCYKGQWQSGTMSGRGIFRWPDGKVYIGDYFNDEKSGIGKLIWSSQKIFIGHFANGLPNGQGRLTIRGQDKIGFFKDGKLKKQLQGSECREKYSNKSFQKYDQHLDFTVEAELIEINKLIKKESKLTFDQPDVLQQHQEHF